MPIYQRSSPIGMLTDDTKAQVAAAITEAHVEATGAPRDPRSLVSRSWALKNTCTKLPPGIACSAGSAPRRSTRSAGSQATRATVAHAVSVLRVALHGG